MKSFKSISFILLAFSIIIGSNSCSNDDNLSLCTDGIQNGTETGVDCGGDCDPCASISCTDGIQNGTETDVDCGGSCDPCVTSSCTDGIQNGSETDIDCGGNCGACPDYYFQITYDGTTYNYDNDFFQAGHSSPDEFGGWVPDFDVFGGNAASIDFNFPDSVQNIDLEDALVGNQISFDGYNSPMASAVITHNLNNEYYYSKLAAETGYYVSVSEVTFLRTDDAFFDMDIYAVKGTFITKIENASGDFSDATGSFYLQCSHGNY